ncbi:hypothetical protein [Marinimicrobium locisalis]|uniref:hypothetical protein n=1 Tax=Marinimicrobium locisalis TaxID=546022 RepID=UPI003221C58D
MKTAIFILSLVVSFHASADWTSNSKINSIKITSSGDALVDLSSYEAFSSGGGVHCEKDVFILSSDDNGFKARYSAILSAHMAGRKVKFTYYGCQGAHIKVGSVVIPS